MDLDHRVRPTDTLGSYLRRLRVLASVKKDRPVSLSEMAELSNKYGKFYRFTKGWLSDTEADKYQRTNSDKLRVLARIYSELIGETIHEEWLMKLAGYPVIQPEEIDKLPPELLRYLQNSEVAEITWLVGRLAEAGHSKGVKQVKDSATRMHEAYLKSLERTIEELLAKEDSSQQLKEFMKAMRL